MRFEIEYQARVEEIHRLQTRLKEAEARLIVDDAMVERAAFALALHFDFDADNGETVEYIRAGARKAILAALTPPATETKE